MRVDIVTPSTPDPVSFAVSPDNRRLVFVASGDGPPRLWLRPLDAVSAQPLSGTEGATYPFWSPDSRSVAFFAGTKLKRIDIGGGLPQNLADALNGRGGTWNADGVILFAPNTSMSLLRVPATGGEATPTTKLDGPRQTSHRFPHFLPGGRQFLFYATGVVEARGVYLGSLDASETKRLTAADTPASYAPPGWLLFIRQGTLVGRRFDPSRAELVGDAVTIAEAVGFDGSVIAGAFSVSAEGLVAYRGGASRRQLTWFDRSGKPVGTLGAPDENGLANPALSPDGRRVMVDRNVQSNIDVWLLDSARTSRFTYDANTDNFPIWSLNGTRIVFRSNRKGAFDLYQKPLSGEGSEELLVESPQVKTALDWSPDGRFLLYQSVDPDTATDLWVLPTTGDRKPFVFLRTNFEERYAQFSPDGQWVAYQSNEAGQDEIYVRRFPGPGGQWQTSTGGGRLPRWRRDGKELYYIAPDGKLMAVPIEARSTTIEAGTPRALFQTRIIFGPSSTQRQQYDVAPDGRFLINVPTEDTAGAPITLLLNWKPPADRSSR
jgi:Tol biopolymer transport system component